MAADATKAQPHAVDTALADADLKPAVIITGGSRGLGFALAKIFAVRGADIAIVARDAQKLTDAACELAAISQRSVISIVCDLNRPDALVEIERTLRTRGFYLDTLVNNAGIGLAGPFVSHSPAEIEALIALNITSLTRLTRQILPSLTARRRGGIINVASLGGYVPGPHQAAYYASKAYVLSLTEALAAEHAGSGVRIAVAVPGPINTAFHADMGAEQSMYRWMIPAMSADAVARGIHRQFALGRRVIMPGLFAPFFAGALKLIPHPISVPLMSWLLVKRHR